MNVTFLNVIDRDRQSLCGFAPPKTSGVTDSDILWLHNNPVILQDRRDKLFRNVSVIQCVTF